jgi:hypothetical protein
MKSGHLLEVVCQMCAVPVSGVYKCHDTSKAVSPLILRGATLLGSMLRRKIAGRVPQIRICQPPIYGRVDNRIRRNSSTAAQIHSKLLLPYSGRSLFGDNLRPQFGDPPGATKGLVLVFSESIRRHIRRFSTKEVSFPTLIDSQT